MTYEDLCAVSKLCGKCLLLKTELLHSKDNLRASIMHPLGGSWSCLVSRMLLTERYY